MCTTSFAKHIVNVKFCGVSYNNNNSGALTFVQRNKKSPCISEISASFYEIDNFITGSCYTVFITIDVK